jgi:glycosyltransferase involved in cell wall biosynthesis
MSIDGGPATALSVVVCTHNRSQSLLETLESLARADVPERTVVEFLVVDNVSTDDTRTRVHEFIGRGNGRFRHVYEPRKGKGFALNRGIEEARGEIIAFTDDDAIVDPGWIRAMVEVFRGSDADCVGGRVRPLWLGERPAWLTDRLLNVLAVADHGDAPYRLVQGESSRTFLGVNVAFRKDFFRRHGLYRTDLTARGGAGNEDMEMCDRVKKLGASALYSPDAVVSHKVPPDRLSRSYFRRWHYLTGRDLARVHGGGGLRLLGIPGWMIRQVVSFLAGYLRAVFTADRDSAFFYELKLIMLLSCFRSTVSLSRGTNGGGDS